MKLHKFAFWALLISVIAPCNAFSSCIQLTDDQSVFETKLLKAGKGGIEVASYETKGDATLGLASSGLVVYDAKCAILYKKNFNFVSKINFRETILGSTNIIVLTKFRFGGSSCQYDHELLKYSATKVDVISENQLSNQNTGGFYLGDLGGGRGIGAVTWDIIFEDGTHYSPHRYHFDYWLWQRERLVSGGKFETQEAHPLDLDDVAKSFGDKIRDQTMREPC